MPNQRAKNKVYIGGYVDKDLQKAIIRGAKAAGMEGNRFGYVASVVAKALGVKPKAKAK